jgi:Tfp pilus assembly PilM family ATPase
LPVPTTGSLDRAVVDYARRRLGERLDAMVLDYAILPEHVVRPDEDTVAVLAFVARQQPVLAALERVVAAGLTPTRLLTPGCALAPWIGRDDPERRYLVYATGEVTTSIVVTQAGVVLLERVLPWGVANLAARLHEELGLDLARARRLLQRPGDTSLRRVLGAPIQLLVRQTGGCIGYCDSFYRPAEVAAAVIVGPLATADLLGPVVAGTLGIPVLSPENALAPDLMVAGEQAAAYAVPIACALWPGEDPA